MAMKSPEIAAAAVPGQFVMIRVGNGMDPLLRRPFSLCGVHEDGRIFLLYRVVGRGTALLSRMAKGDTLSILGPLGKGFRFPEKEEQALLVAGGMGIAPLIFLSGRIGPSVSGFFAGYGSSRDLIPHADLPTGGVEISVSTDDGSAGHHGLVTDLLEAGLDRIREMVRQRFMPADRCPCSRRFPPLPAEDASPARYLWRHPWRVDWGRVRVVP